MHCHLILISHRRGVRNRNAPKKNFRSILLPTATRYNGKLKTTTFKRVILKLVFYRIYDIDKFFDKSTILFLLYINRLPGKQVTVTSPGVAPCFERSAR